MWYISHHWERDIISFKITEASYINHVFDARRFPLCLLGRLSEYRSNSFIMVVIAVRSTTSRTHAHVIPLKRAARRNVIILTLTLLTSFTHVLLPKRLHCFLVQLLLLTFFPYFLTFDVCYVFLFLTSVNNSIILVVFAFPNCYSISVLWLHQRLDNRETGIWFFALIRDFIPTACRPVRGPTQPLIYWLFTEGTLQWPSSGTSDYRNSWKYTSTSPYTRIRGRYFFLIEGTILIYSTEQSHSWEAN